MRIHLLKKVPAFTETGDSQPYSQKSSVWIQSWISLVFSYLYILFKNPFDVILPSAPMSFKLSSIEVFQSKFCDYFVFPLLAACHTNSTNNTRLRHTFSFFVISFIVDFNTSSALSQTTLYQWTSLRVKEQVWRTYKITSNFIVLCSLMLKFRRRKTIFFVLLAIHLLFLIKC